jgi:hypothetical protein
MGFSRWLPDGGLSRRGEFTVGNPSVTPGALPVVAATKPCAESSLVPSRFRRGFGGGRRGPVV